MIEYPIVIVPLENEDGGGFLGYVPDLPGCMSDGDTKAEALVNTELAMKEWLDLQHVRGIDPPLPGTASDEAQQREDQLLDAIRSLAQFRDQVEEENQNLKRKLAELIAVLRDSSGKSKFSIDVPASLIPSKPYRAH
jgi:predicted RNase H-like HicB family nuclease